MFDSPVRLNKTNTALLPQCVMNRALTTSTSNLNTNSSCHRGSLAVCQRRVDDGLTHRLFSTSNFILFSIPFCLAGGVTPRDPL
mgnify:CR=1 FL=1